MMIEYPAHAAAAEIRSLAVPMSTQTTWASLGIESHASLAATAVRRTAESLDALRVLVACELVVALRALTASGRAPAGAAARRLSELARGRLPTDLSDRPFGRELQTAAELLRHWED